MLLTNPGQYGSTEGEFHMTNWLARGGIRLKRPIRPGASSLLGLLLENGPLLVADGGGLVQNNASWAHLVDYVWVDQPV